MLIIGIVLFSGFAAFLSYDFLFSKNTIKRQMKHESLLILAFRSAIRSSFDSEFRPLIDKRFSDDGWNPEWMSSHAFARKISDNAAMAFSDFVIKYASEKPRNPINAAYPPEIDVINEFEKSSKDMLTDTIEIGGRLYYAFFKSIRAKDSCLKCHGNPSDAPPALIERYGRAAGFNYQAGDIIGIETVAIPSEYLEEPLYFSTLSKSALLVIILLMVFAVGAFVFKHTLTEKWNRISNHLINESHRLDPFPIEKIEPGDQNEMDRISEAFNQIADNINRYCRLAKNRNVHLKETNDWLSLENKKLQAEKSELIRTQNVMSNIFDSIIDSVITTDLDGTIMYMSSQAKKLLGCEVDECKGVKVYSYYKNGIEDAKKIMAQLKSKGALKEYDLKIRNAYGDIIDVILSASMLRNESGTIIGTLGVFRDITEKKQTELHLQSALRNQALGTLCGGIAHNFNNLLMIIQGYASIMLTGLDDTHPHFKMVSNIEKQIQIGAELTKQLMGYTAKENKYELCSIDLHKVVQETADAFSMPNPHIRVHLDMHTDKLRVFADYHQIGQVLMNVYVNACEAMPDGGDLYIRAYHMEYSEIPPNARAKLESRSYVAVEIQDTGIGIDEKNLGHIFEPFFTTKDMKSGVAGLGLSSAFGIVHAHNGCIDVFSEKGQGATFTVYLPCAEEIERKKIEQASSKASLYRGTETILLVDDEEMIIDVSRQMLEKLGYSVLIADNGNKAVDIYKRSMKYIDLVILDMIMPGMDGKEVYETLKRINPTVKVIFLSGFCVDGQLDQRYFEMGNGFIQKPLSINALSQKIREILDA